MTSTTKLHPVLRPRGGGEIFIIGGFVVFFFGKCSLDEQSTSKEILFLNHISPAKIFNMLVPESTCTFLLKQKIFDKVLHKYS